MTPAAQVVTPGAQVMTERESTEMKAGGEINCREYCQGIVYLTAMINSELCSFTICKDIR